MTYFTNNNTDWSADELEIVNQAFDEAWGAIERRDERLGERWDEDDVYQAQRALGDAINNAWLDGIDSETLAENALRSIGMTPVRDQGSLEISA